MLKKEEEQKIVEAEKQNFDNSSSSDDDNVISPGGLSDSKTSAESTSGRITTDHPQAEQSETFIHEERRDAEMVFADDIEEDPEPKTTDIPALEAVSDRCFDTEPFLLPDLLYRVSKLEQHQQEFESELQDTHNMNAIISHLETVEERVKYGKKYISSDD